MGVVVTSITTHGNEAKVVVEVVVEMVTVMLQSGPANDKIKTVLKRMFPKACWPPTWAAKGPLSTSGQLTYGIIFHLRHKPIVAYSLKSHAYRPYVRTARSRNGDDNGTTARSASLQVPLRTT